MVRSKEILICNPRPNPCVPCLNPRNPSPKRKKRRNSTSPLQNSHLLEMVKFLHNRLGNVNLSPEDKEYIEGYIGGGLPYWQYSSQRVSR
jgi:hypothetical protein